MIRKLFFLGVFVFFRPAVLMAAECVEENAVVIEEFQFKGKLIHDDSLLRSYFDIESRRCLLRSELDEALSDAETRFKLRGQYRVDSITLVKGSKRQYYIVLTHLMAVSPVYFGGKISSGRLSKYAGGSGRKDPEKFQRYDLNAYTGTQSLFDSELRADFNVDYGQIDDKDGKTPENRKTVLGAFNLLHPNVFGEGVIAGVTLLYFGFENLYKHSFEYETDKKYEYLSEYEYRSSVKGAALRLGKRFGLFSAYGGFYRHAGESESTNHSIESEDGVVVEDKKDKESDEYYYSQASFSVVYSSKSDIAYTEPGSYGKLTYSRTVAPDWEEPNYEVELEHTLMPLSWLALTPIWHSFIYYNRYNGVLEIERIHRFGTRFDFVIKRNSVVSFKAMTINNPDSDYSYKFDRYFKLSYNYITPRMHMELGFVMGEENYFTLTDDLYNDRRVMR